MRDDIPFYARIEPQLTSGAFGPAEPMQIILPYNTVPNEAVIIHGTAAAGVPSAALEINLPGLCNDFSIKNVTSGKDLYVSFAHGTSTGPQAPEFLVAGGETLDMDYANAARVFVRGGTGGSAEIYSVFTQKTQPLNL